MNQSNQSNYAINKTPYHSWFSTVSDAQNSNITKRKYQYVFMLLPLLFS